MPETPSPRATADRFEQLAWADDDRSFELDGYRYLVEDVRTETDEGAFRFYKPRPMVEQYRRFVAQTEFVPATVLELGIFDGGSVAFWCDLLEPTAYLAVDKETRGDSALFRRWVDERDRAGVVDTRWGVDQADHDALWGLLADHDLDRVDLVIDDASHSYGPTLASFAGLFPKVRPGGFYVIEDWSWPYREPYCRRDHPWAVRPTLLPIVDDLVAALGSNRGAVTQVLCFPDFVAVQRGPVELDCPFDVRTQITPRERPYVKLGVDAARRYSRKAVRVAREASGRVRGT